MGHTGQVYFDETKKRDTSSQLLQQPWSFLEGSALAIPLKPSTPLSQLHPYLSICLMLIQPLGLSINATFSDNSFLASKIRMLLWNTEIFHFCIYQMPINYLFNYILMSSSQTDYKYHHGRAMAALLTIISQPLKLYKYFKNTCRLIGTMHINTSKIYVGCVVQCACLQSSWKWCIIAASSHGTRLMDIQVVV